MAKKGLKRIIALATMMTTLFSTTITYASNIKNQNDAAYNSLYQSDTCGVLKVNVDNDGQLSYQLPVSATSLEVGSGKWGDKVYDEDRSFSWDNANLYFVMNDRFVNGDSSNDHSYGRGEGVSNYDTKYGYFHGGDLKGLTSKVKDGYFDNLGTNAIWITAPYEQIHGALSSSAFKHYAYHGYYALDYTEVDKNMGTAEDLEEFIDTAHSHGIRVVFDIVMNHAGYANPVDANEFGYGALTSNWQEIYKWDDSKYKWFNDYAPEASQNGSEGMMDTSSGDWETNWWGSKWVRMVEGRFSAYQNQAPEAAGVNTCVSGLPDFVTEGTSDPGMPGILKKKWDATKLATEEKELDEFCKNYNMSKNVTTYLVKWLTDWVREYGVDGFRCDTAKHVEKSVWGQLSKAGSQALDEWRENNKDKPGANWTDDFWMTGEDWGHGVSKDDYFTTGGFESMINFSFQGNESKTGLGLESLFADYAQKINSDPSFNVLSYISSHDKGLGARSVNAGTALLLCPGGVQTYYGDETGRTGDGAPDDQASRSNMNWSSINKEMLSHWQKVGQFRSDHIAVGAGTHTKLADSPYSFSRIYEKDDISDKVVVGISGQAGSCEITCGDTFEDGATVIDYYTGKDYMVSDGKVIVEAGENGVVLLSEGAPSTKTSVSASASSGDFYEDPLEVTLRVRNADKGTYSVNGENEKEYEDGDKIVITEESEIGESFELVIKASSKDGGEAEKTYIYTKAEKPIIKNLIIHAKNTNWANPINAYVYQGDGAFATQLTGAWPGKAMQKGEDGWYTIEVETTDPANIIFNCGTSSADRDPADKQPGFEKQGECWYLDGKWYDKDPEAPIEELKIESLAANPKIGIEGEKVIFTATANKEGLSYEFFNGETSIGKSTTGKVTWTPDATGTYKIKVVVTDKNDETDNKTIDYVVEKKETIDDEDDADNGDNTGDDETFDEDNSEDTDDIENDEDNSEGTDDTEDDEDNSEDTNDTEDTDIEDDDVKPSDEFTVKITPSINSCLVGDKVVFKLSTTNADGDVTYVVKINGKKQTVLKDNTVEWIPADEGEYNILVIATTDDGSRTETSINSFVVKAADEDLDDNNSENTSDKSMMVSLGLMAVLSLGYIATNKKKK